MKEGDVKTKPTLQDWGCLFTFFMLTQENRWSGFTAHISQVCLPSSMQMESIHEITAMDSLKSRGSVPTGMGPHSSLLCQTHHSNWHSGSWLCKAIPQRHPASKCKWSICQPCKAFPSLRTINRRCSENLFYQPFWVYTYGDVISVVAQRRTITWNGFGVSLVSFLASFQETDKHKSDITLIHRSWGVSILVLLSPVRLSSHLDTSSRFGLPWWIRWYRICLQCGRP